MPIEGLELGDVWVASLGLCVPLISKRVVVISPGSPQES